VGDAPMAPKYGRAIVFLDLGVPQTWSSDGKRRLIERLEELFGVRDGSGVGPSGEVLQQFVCHAEYDREGVEGLQEVSNGFRLEYPLISRDSL
jgi:hypothetical protein